MYAKLINSIIKVYSKLPSKYRSETLNVAGGFDKLPNNVHQQEGFYHIIEPSYDSEIERLGTLYFDSENGYFTYAIETISAYEIAMKGWHHQNYAMRFKIALLDINTSADLQWFVSQLLLWWDLTKLEHEVDETHTYFYCNFIIPEHQAIVDNFSGLIIIENIPMDV